MRYAIYHVPESVKRREIVDQTFIVTLKNLGTRFHIRCILSAMFFSGSNICFMPYFFFKVNSAAFGNNLSVEFFFTFTVYTSHHTVTVPEESVFFPSGVMRYA